MSATTTQPKPKPDLDQVPAKLEVDTCNVCLAPDANPKVYVGVEVLNPNRRVWMCECGNEWKREIEDTAKC